MANVSKDRTRMVSSLFAAAGLEAPARRNAKNPGAKSLSGFVSSIPVEFDSFTPPSPCLTLDADSRYRSFPCKSTSSP